MQSFVVPLCPEQHVGHRPVLGLHLLLLHHIPPFSPATGDLLDDILKRIFCEFFSSSTLEDHARNAFEFYSENVDEEEKTKEANS